MRFYCYQSPDEYVREQIRKNQKKLHVVAASAEELNLIAKKVNAETPNVQFAICHGVRNGWEVQELRRLLGGVNVIGTDIAPTASQFPHVIQADFHNIREEWLGNVDFIYSNSWDHSHDPERAFRNWLRCLKPNGQLFLQWTEDHGEANVDSADCFGASLPELKDLIGRLGKLEGDTEIAQWSLPPRGNVYSGLRRLLKRHPVKVVHLLTETGVIFVFLILRVTSKLPRPRLMI